MIAWNGSLTPQLRPREVAAIPKVAVRRLIGDGVHDAGEVLAIPESLLDGIDSYRLTKASMPRCMGFYINDFDARWCYLTVGNCCQRGGLDGSSYPTCEC